MQMPKLLTMAPPSYEAVMALKALRLYERDQEAGWQVIKNLTGTAIKAAAHLAEAQAEVAQIIETIGERNGGPAKTNEPLGRILKRAARNGDKDAALLISKGLLDKIVY